MASKLRSRLFARYYDTLAARYDRIMAPRKREFLADMRGLVVEIGPGTGVNLALLPGGIEWIGIEPNEDMHPILREKADALGFEVDLRALVAEKLPLENDSVDTVLSTLVLCSIPDLCASLEEIKRVLKPGGRFYFWEHVIAPERSLVRGMQHLLAPVQRFLADGCCINRDLGLSIREAGFASVELEEFRIPKRAAPFWIRPHVTGIATK